MNNDDLDKLARQCGLGSIYERPQPIEIGGVIKWESSGEITPFGQSLINLTRNFNQSKYEEMEGCINAIIAISNKRETKLLLNITEDKKPSFSFDPLSKCLVVQFE